LIKFYVADQVIAAPTDFWQQTSLRAENASYFSLTKLKVLTGINLVATNTTRGDTQASTANVAVWDTFTSIRDPDSGADVQVQGRRMAFDRRSGELVNCCSASVDQDTTVKQSGLGLLWPIGMVQQRTYAYFDQTTKQAWPMEFAGEEQIAGLPTYRFVQHIPQTSLGLIAGASAQLFGMDKRKKGNTKVERLYRATVTMWVDPRTGIPVSQREQVTSSARAVDGAGSVILADADLRTSAADQQALVKVSDGYAWKFAAMRNWIPVGSLIFGLFLLGSGVLLPRFERGGTRDRRTPSHAKTTEPARASKP
jgi:hypothetical protein